MSFAPNTTRFLLMLTAGLSMASPAVGQPLACRYEISAVLEAPTCGLGGVSTIGTAINPSGTTVVGYRFCLGTAMPWKWTHQTGLVMLTLPPWLVEARPADVNDNNIMVGTGVGTQAGQRAWMCDLNTMTWTELLPQNPPLGWSEASAISTDNTVVGFRSIGSKGDPVHPYNACIWDSVGVADLGVMNGPNSSAMDIAEDGTVVGWTGASQTSTGTRGFVHQGGEPTILPPVLGGTTSSLRAINDRGTFACGRGLRTIAGGQTISEAFIWDGGSITPIGALQGSTIVFAFAIANESTVVGICRSVQPTVDRAYVWQSGVMRELDELVDGTLQFEAANDITNNGKVVAVGGASTFLLEATVVVGDAVPDCVVNVDDVICVILNWGATVSPADVTGDGVVNVDDLICVILSWSP
jgi:uncharacterized membrane protein